MDDEQDPKDDLAIPAILLDDEEIDIEIDISQVDLYERVKENPVADVIPLRKPEPKAMTEETSPTESKNEKFVSKIFAKLKALDRKKKILVSSIAFLVFLSIVGLTLESPIFRFDNYELKNTSATELTQSETQEIGAILQSYTGEPLYRAKVAEISSKLEEIHSITDISIEKDWPNSLEITFSRRTPVAYVVTDKGIVLLDANGFVFAKAQEQPQSLPAFEGIAQMDLYQTIPDSSFIDIMNNFPDEIKNQVVQVKVLDSGVFEAVLSDGITIKLGQPVDLERKLAIAWSIIMAKSRDEIGYIDVSVPNLPISGSPELQV